MTDDGVAHRNVLQSNYYLCHRICYTINKIVYNQHLLVSFEELLSLRLSDPFALVVGWINNNWPNLWKRCVQGVQRHFASCQSDICQIVLVQVFLAGPVRGRGQARPTVRNVSQVRPSLQENRRPPPGSDRDRVLEQDRGRSDRSVTRNQDRHEVRCDLRGRLLEVARSSRLVRQVSRRRCRRPLRHVLSIWILSHGYNWTGGRVCRPGR